MDWLHRVFGLEPGQDRLQWDRVFLVLPWPRMGLIAGAGLILVWLLFFYYRDGTRPSWIWKGLMVLLRVGAMAVLALMVCQPMLRSQRTESNPSVVAVVLDESSSMRLKDRWRRVDRRRDLVQALGDPRAGDLARSAALYQLLGRDDSRLLRRLAGKHTVRIYRFGADVTGKELAVPQERGPGKEEPASGRNRPTPASRSATAETERLPLSAGKSSAEQTRIGSALEYVLQDTAGQPLAGIVLCSDGGQNMGEDPTAAARRVAEERAPIFTVGFGDPQPPQDVAITSLLADEVVRKGDEVVVSVAVRQRGYPGRTVPLTLKLGDRVLETRNVQLAPEGQKQEVNLSFTPTEAGARTLTVSLPGLSGELTLSNNQKAWPIRVVDKKLKILYIEGRPRWEFRFLKNAILRDQTTLFACILTDADPALGGEGNVPIYGFPRERKALFDYDIVILGDVPRNFLSAGDMKNIRAFVEERGGSLITIAGEVSLPWDYRGTELETVWPIVAPQSRRETLFREPFQLALTDAGARHPMCFLVPDVEQNRNLWHSLAGMYWCGVAERAKPGATVLAQHPTMRGTDGNIPLMALQQVGEGMSFMTMVDSTWQWRFRVGDKYFYRFWGQVVRSLTPHELPGANRFVRLTADRTTYALGEKVVLRARLLTPNFHPVRLKEVQAEMERTDGQRYPVRLEPVPGAAGVYSGEWQPAQAGSFRGLLNMAGAPRGESLTNVVVEASSLELEMPQQNEALLRRISGVTGGKYLLWSEVAGLADQIPDRRQVVSTRVEHSLWDAPLPISVFLVLLVGEWLLRKRSGLL